MNGFAILQWDGIIRGWTINVDSEFLGLGVLVYVGVSAA
jgi:hypothetical protein